MYWLRRPPYLRWISAALVLCSGMYLDMRPAPVVAYPFTAAPVTTGDVVEEVAWRDVPRDVLPTWVGPVAGVAVTDIPAGSPLLPSLVTEATVPVGWWAVSLALPQRAAPGTPVRVTAGDSFADGMVAGGINDAGYELTAPVAFPPESASLVAAMTADSTVVVMIGTPRR